MKNCLILSFIFFLSFQLSPSFSHQDKSLHYKTGDAALIESNRKWIKNLEKDKLRIKLSKLKVGDKGFVFSKNLYVCEGHYVLGDVIVNFEGHKTIKKRIKEDYQHYWWIAKRLSKDLIELEFVPQKNNLNSYEQFFNDYDNWLKDADICNSIRPGNFNRGITPTEREEYTNKILTGKIDNIDGAKSMSEFIKKLQYLISKVKK